MESISYSVIFTGFLNLYKIPQTTDTAFGKPINLDALHNYTLPVSTDATAVKTPTFLPLRLKREALTEDNDFFEITVKTLTGKAVKVKLNQSSKVEDLKKLVANNIGVPSEEQRLFYGEKQLEDGRMISEYKIAEGSTVHIVLMPQGRSGYLFLTDKLFDTNYNFIYPKVGEDTRAFSRGNRSFQRPYGWEKKALRVLGIYENDDWLGAEGRDTEWPVSYHGTKKEFAESISEEGYLLSKGKRFAYGKGIYSTPDPNVAENYAQPFTHDEKTYKLIFMNRLNMEYTKEVKLSNGNIYFVTSDDKKIRPYAILIKQIN